MGLEKITYSTKYTPAVNIKLSAIAAAMGRAKMYELLHKQIWRKAKYSRVHVYSIPGLTQFKGRPVAFIERWNIKSPSKQPYAYEAYGAEMAFGLNQLFKGEGYSPYAHYGRVDQIYWDINYTISGVTTSLRVYTYSYNQKSKKFTKLADSVSIENINGSIYKRMHLGTGHTDELLTTLSQGQTFTGYSIVRFHTGDPKDGIYHDDCYIIPKMIPASAEHYYYVCTISDETSTRLLFRERDENGVIDVISVVLENYVATVAGRSHDRYRLVVTHASGAVDRIDLGADTHYWLFTRVERLASHDVLGYVEEYKVEYDFSSHGPVVWEQVTDMPFQFTSSSRQSTTLNRGTIRAYSDGTVIQYRPLEVEWGESTNNIIPGHYKILPMVYTDTGDLTMPVADFVNNWAEYFELIVHEDSEWWESFLAPVLAIVTVVLSVIAWPVVAAMGPVISAMFVAGTAMSVVGILSGDKTLSALGGVMAGVAGLVSAVGQAGRSAITQAGIEAGFSGFNASSVAAEATIGEVFSNFMSTGFENLAKIGSSVLKLTTSAMSLGNADVQQESVVEEAVEASQIEFTTTLGQNEDEYDVYGQIERQYRLY